MVAPFPGVTDNNWVDEWLSLRKQLLLPDFDKLKPSFPRVNMAGKFGDIPLSSSEAGNWLRTLLGTAGLIKPSDKRITSHGLKATVLSWAAKYGIPKEQRSILGYHILDTQQSMLHYSRDEQALPLRSVETMLKDIRSKFFRPDETRSGYFQTTGTVMQPTPKSAAHPSTFRQSSSSGSSSSSESESSAAMSEEENLARAVETSQLKTQRLKLSEKNVFAVHSRFKTLHIVKDQHSSKLKCGRNLSAVYRVLADMPSFNYPKCTDCFGR